MSGLLGGGGQTISNSETAALGITIQTSAYGLALPIVYGRTRIGGNLVWYGDFTAIPHTTTQSSGGKGGGGTKVSSTTYTYSASFAFGLCEGPITALNGAWVDKSYSANAFGTDSAAINEVTSGGVLTTTAEIFAIATASPLRVTVANAATWVDDAAIQAGGGRWNGESLYDQPMVVKHVWAGHASYDTTALTLGVDYTVANGVYLFNTLASNDTFNGSYLEIIYGYLAGATTTLQLSLSGSAALFSGFLGGYPQAAWSYLTSKHAEQAVTYPGVAYAAAGNYDLGSQTSLPNHTFDVTGLLPFAAGTIDDANPRDIVQDVLTNPHFSGVFPLAKVGDWTAYSQYCVASGIFLSPAYDTQQAAQQIVADLMALTNGGVYFSEGLLKVVPLGDTAVSGNGAIYAPPAQAVYDLTDDDYIVAGAEDPVRVTRSSQADAYNQVQVEFCNRANNYNIEIATAQDQTAIDTFGLRPMATVAAHQIASAPVARTVSQILLQRALYIRNQYEFTLGWKYCLLEPTDIVTLTDSGLGLSKYPVRILSIEENDSGELTLTAEDYLHGVSSNSLYPSQSGIGFNADFNVSPGNVALPEFFEVAAADSSTGLAVGVAVTGTSQAWAGCDVWVSYDGLTYKRQGRVNGGARYGITGTTVSANANDQVSVVLSGLGGQLLPASATEAARLATLCILGDEFCAYSNATLAFQNGYFLSLAVRGAKLSTAAAHTAWTRFIRWDDAVLISDPLDLSLITQTIYFKFCSFNTYGGGLQGLSDVEAIPYTVLGTFALGPPPDVTNFTASALPTNGGTTRTIVLKWDALHTLDFSNYELRSGTDWLTATIVQQDIKDPFFTVLNSPAGVAQSYLIKGVDLRGNYSVNAPVTTVPADATVQASALPGDVVRSATVTVDALGNAVIAFDAIVEPQIASYELRSGATFETGTVIASTTSSPFSVPILSLSGLTLWIKGVYAAGGYTSVSFRIAFGVSALNQIQGLSWRVSEPDLVFSWGAVAGASQYVALFEDGGVSRIKVVATPEVSFAIPKYGASVFRVFAVGSTGGMSPYSDLSITLTGIYNYNEIVNISLPITSGTYVNLAFTAANQIKRVSLLGSAPAAPYAQNINDADLYSFGYNLQNLAASALVNTPAAWFRQGFWNEKNGFFESGVLDLGSVLSGKLLLNLTKSITFTGNTAVSNFSQVNAGYMSGAYPQEVTDTKAFLSARLLVANDSPNSANWVEVQNGDWVTSVRYVKLVVEVALAGPLTDVTVTAGFITLDVPDISEQGSKTGVTSAGAAITFVKTYNHISAVLATVRGSARANTGSITTTGCTLYVDTGTQTVDYFVKGY